MALSRQALNGYDAALSKVEAAAAEYVRRRVEAYLESFPNASVADVREFAKEVVGQAVDAYGDAASTAAADLYDELAEAAGESLPSAAVDTSDVSGYIDRGVRYQAGKLVDGAPTAFAARVSDIARDQVARRANQTMIRNAGRDRIRYARVPTGPEPCTYCAMLASRGFVYRTESSAAAATGHFHHGCRCKVVPSTAGSVEGYDPDEWADRWHAMEGVDADPRLTAAQKLEAKGRIAGGGERNGIDRSASVYSGIPDEYVDIVHGIVEKASGSAKELYLRHEGNFLETGLSGNGGSFYRPSENRVYFNGLDEVFGGNGKETGDTWFHEFGHNVDWLAGGGRSYAETWRGGAFQKKLASEAKAYAASRKKDVLPAVRKALETRDRNEVWRTCVVWKLATKRDFWDWDTGRITAAELLSRCKKPTINHAYKLVERELNSLPQDETVAVSDIFDGATRHKIKDGWGHFRKKGNPEYWDGDGRALSHEAFAELFACHLSSPKGLARMREYFPESCELFDEMLSDMANGGA